MKRFSNFKKIYWNSSIRKNLNFYLGPLILEKKRFKVWISYEKFTKNLNLNNSIRVFANFEARNFNKQKY